MSLQRAVFALLAAVLIAGLLPFAWLLDRRASAMLEDRTRAELALAPRLLADRQAVVADAMMMHAKELAAVPGLAAAVLNGDSVQARGLAAGKAAGTDVPVVITRSGAALLGPSASAQLLEATRRGEMPVAAIADRQGARVIALSPLKHEGRWIGAAGVARMLDGAETGTLAALSRSDVIILDSARNVTAAMGDPALIELVQLHASRLALNGQVVMLEGSSRRALVVAAALSPTVTAVFARDMARELAMLPPLRRVAGVGGALALLIMLLIGGAAAAALARPARALAAAADRVAAGDFAAPLVPSRVTELRRLAGSFDDMRRALSARLRELQEANVALSEKQSRLAALQAEMLQRDRVVTAGRLVTTLAHEIRNPVAAVRNCLELIRRRLDGDTESREYADMAIHELRRMHELTEQMLHLHRPKDSGARTSDADAVAREVALLTRIGVGQSLDVRVTSPGSAPVAIPPDPLKQVLLNLVQNASEATLATGCVEIRITHDGGRVCIDVTDDGPGIADDVLPRLFDPFFTTKGDVRGVGLGLFVADGIVRAHGGVIKAGNRSERRGARLTVELRGAATTASDSQREATITEPAPA